MRTWLNRGASGGLAGALKTEKESVKPNQSTASHTEIRTPPDAEVVLLKLMVDKLKLQLLRSLRARFGSSSEQFDVPQIALLEDEPLYERPAPVVPAAPDAANAPQIDRKLPAHLPRESQVHRPETSTTHHDADGQPCGCTACGGHLRLIGRDVSEQLEYVPSHFKVIRHVRPKLACVACEAIFQAAAPSRPIARGKAGPGLLANVLVSKYCDHIPLHRLSRIYGRDGVVIDPSTMAGWVGQSEKLFDTLLAALGRYVLAGEKHADDTPVAVLDPGRGRTKTGRLWVYVRDDRGVGNTEPPAAWYRYSPNRKGEHPQAHLANYSGILQADAYGGYGKIYASGRVVEAACWAHARRPFWDLHESQGFVAGSIAEQALQRIAALYAIEAEIRGHPPDVRRQARQARAGPLLEDLRAWLESMLGRVSKKSELARAIGYSLGRWRSLTRYLDDGRIEIDTDAFDKRFSVTPLVQWALASSSKRRRTVGIPLQPYRATPVPCPGPSSSYSCMPALACFRRGEMHVPPSARVLAASIASARGESTRSLRPWSTCAK